MSVAAKYRLMWWLNGLLVGLAIYIIVSPGLDVGALLLQLAVFAAWGAVAVSHYRQAVRR